MNFPVQFGLPQFVLLLFALGGCALFIYAAHGIIRGEKHYGRLTADEKEIYYRHGRLPRRRRLRIKSGTGGLVLVVLAVSLLWLTSLAQAYLGLTGDVLAARVVATSLVGVDHAMSVTLTIMDENGKPMPVKDPQGRSVTSMSYVVYGDEWMLQATVIKVNPFLNVLGVHTGYKITRLQGRYDDINLEQNGKRSVYAINGGDDGFFQRMREWKGWITPFIDAQYGNATFTGPGTYDVFASQTGLFPRSVGG